MRHAISLLTAIVALLLAAGIAQANLPDPYQCSFDECLGRSPKNSTAEPSGQYTYHAYLRDAQGSPIPFFPPYLVELEILAPCANPVVLNPDADSAPDGHIYWGADKLNQGGGACAGAAVVEIRVNGMLFFMLDDVRSPDEDGDTLVALADLQAWQMAFVNQTPIHHGDLDCDGYIALSDLSLWQKHFVAP